MGNGFQAMTTFEGFQANSDQIGKRISSNRLIFMAIIIVAIQSVEIGMATQALSGSKITIAGIEVGSDGTMPDSMGRDYLIDSGRSTKLSHQAINSTAVESMSLSASIQTGKEGI